MPNKPVYVVTDPDNVPVKVVNAVAQYGVIGSLVSLTLTTARSSFSPDGKVEPDMVVAARLRFDLEVARILRDRIDAQIKLLTAPPKTKAN